MLVRDILTELPVFRSGEESLCLKTWPFYPCAQTYLQRGDIASNVDELTHCKRSWMHSAISVSSLSLPYYGLFCHSWKCLLFNELPAALYASKRVIWFTSMLLGLHLYLTTFTHNLNCTITNITLRWSSLLSAEGHRKGQTVFWSAIWKRVFLHFPSFSFYWKKYCGFQDFIPGIGTFNP